MIPAAASVNLCYIINRQFGTVVSAVGREASVSQLRGFISLSR